MVYSLHQLSQEGRKAFNAFLLLLATIFFPYSVVIVRMEPICNAI